MSLQDALYCSTQLSIRWHHCKILRPTCNFLQKHLQEPEFFWFTSDVFLKRPVLSYRDSYVKFLRGGLQAKVVPESTPYRTWGVPQRVPSSVSASRLRSGTSSWWPQERGAEQSAPTHACHTHCTSRQLGTTANQRCDIPWDWLWDACQMARVRWGTRCEGFRCKGGPHYQIEQSARNPLEPKQVWRALGVLSRSCHQTSNNQPLFTSLEIPWGFLAWTVLHWLSRGLCHARKCQFKDIMWEEKVWFTIAQLMFAWETFGKRQNGERKPVLILVPGSCERLTSKKHIMCARNMGVHVWHWSTKGMRKWYKKSDSCAAEKGREETSK